MNLSNQSKTLSKMTGSDIDRKIKSDINFRKNISKNMDFGVLSKNRKIELLKDIELDKLKKYVDNISVYNNYNAAQISNICSGYENGIDVSFYENMIILDLVLMIWHLEEEFLFIIRSILMLNSI